MKTQIHITDWRLCIVPNRSVREDRFAPTTADGVLNSPYGTIPAAVPGSFELDMMNAGLLPDLYYADNILLAQQLENRHLWYTAAFDYVPQPECNAFLTFAGIDTAAEIFLDGEKIGESENMFLPFTYPMDAVSPGAHEIVVHVTPALLYARGRHLAASAHAMSYNDDSLKIRKARYMFGWDIMPRLVSAGLWKPVYVEYRPKNRIDDVFLYPRALSETHADMRIKIAVTVDDDFLTGYSYRVQGRCRGSAFCFERALMSVDALDGFGIDRPYLWYPKNYGRQDLYDVTVSLLKDGEVCDSVSFRMGLRIVELERTSLAGDGGEFVFRVNDKKIFAMGSNLVPTDAFPARQKAYTLRQCEMLNDLGCNMVRCWGGNIYPDESLFDFCDEHGILVWQDFSMACARYPEDRRTQDLIEKEVRHVVRTYRNHASLALWAGDNECDDSENRQYIYGRRTNAVDPNLHALTRGVIPFVLRNEDFTRPYLPSSPFADRTAFEANKTDQAAEQHLWGPRDFFKGPFYVNSTAHFASETGYHGCPSPASLKKFISPDALDKMGDGQKSENPEWMLHSSTFRITPDAPFNYRNSLMIRQVERLFGFAAKDLHTFALQSQISQAEAKKFFIEHFRCAKWRRTGILWWNLIDGWPQVSDAVVDWYETKKLAYGYIKRSQQPFCLLFDEPAEGKLTLRAANDLQTAVHVSYRVTDLTNGRRVCAGEYSAAPNACEQITAIPETPGSFYLIEWTGDRTGRNHYTADIYHGIDFESYVANMKKAGFWDEMEGFLSNSCI
ncbi:MAG: hypothetical protein IJK02_08140 [Clostridia bacterium]|nr:hypothetical protein [Clostridia bacterium]